MRVFMKTSLIQGKIMKSQFWETSGPDISRQSPAGNATYPRRYPPAIISSWKSVGMQDQEAFEMFHHPGTGLRFILHSRCIKVV